MGNCTKSQSDGNHDSFQQRQAFIPDYSVKIHEPPNIYQQFSDQSVILDQMHKYSASTAEIAPGSVDSSSSFIPENRASMISENRKSFTENRLQKSPNLTSKFFKPLPLEQIEELESSSCLQNELKQIQDINHKDASSGSSTYARMTLKNQTSLQEITQINQENEDQSISPKKQNTNNPNENSAIFRYSQLGKTSIDVRESDSSQSNSPTRSQASSKSFGIFFSGLKMRSAQEIHTTFRIQTQKFFSKLTSTELNGMLQRGANIHSVLSHFKFSSASQIIDLILDLYNLILGKRTKLDNVDIKEQLVELIGKMQQLIQPGIDYFAQLKEQMKKSTLINISDNFYNQNNNNNINSNNICSSIASSNNNNNNSKTNQNDSSPEFSPEQFSEMSNFQKLSKIYQDEWSNQRDKKLGLRTLGLLVEIYQMIQFCLLPQPANFRGDGTPSEGQDNTKDMMVQDRLKKVNQKLDRFAKRFESELSSPRLSVLNGSQSKSFIESSEITEFIQKNQQQHPATPPQVKQGLQDPNQLDYSPENLAYSSNVSDNPCLAEIHDLEEINKSKFQKNLFKQIISFDSNDTSRKQNTFIRNSTTSPLDLNKPTQQWQNDPVVTAN